MAPRMHMRKQTINPNPKPPPRTRKPPNASRSSGRQGETTLNDAASASTNPNIHRDRAQRWGTTAYIAEWFANAVEYCKSPRVQQDFERWVRKNYVPEEAVIVLEQCKEPPVKRHGSSSGNAKMWNSAAFELGVSDTAMKNYHMFTSEKDLVAPPRTLPPLKRKRHELSTAWLARRAESMLQGLQAPDIDWEEARRIAVSQLDETIDVYEIWHTDPEVFINGLIERARSTIVHPSAMEGMDDPWQRDLQLRTDAYRSRLHLLHVARAQWNLAVALFDELDQKGLKTTAAVEKAYNSDSGFKWRLISVATLTITYCSRIGPRTSQVLAALPAFSKYLKRYRTNEGNMVINIDHAFLRSHPYPPNSIDELIVTVCSSRNSSALEFALPELKEQLRKFPKEAYKFDDVAWREIGEYAVAIHFMQELCSSPFGRRLHEAACESKTMMGQDLDVVFEELAFMKRSRISIWPGHDHGAWNYGKCRGIMEGMVDEWLSQIFHPGFAADRIVRCDLNIKKGFLGGSKLEDYFDLSWMETDSWVWTKARELDPPGQSGKVAKMFGLYNPSDPKKPSWTNQLLFTFKEQSSKPALTRKASPPPHVKRTETVPPIPVAGPHDSAVQSGHGYSAAKGKPSKEKIKTRGQPSVVASTDGHESAEEDDSDVEFPDNLPPNFKLPKKVYKTFQRILELDEVVVPDAPKKGQVRWDDFEKAMKRVGFDIVQTAGSSVRFDPPAKTARPISFHRPHPDSLLNPFKIKWIGARLKRYYGWTTATFSLASSDE